MPYPIDEKLVVAVASSALFDLTASDRVFRERGLEAYREHQRENEGVRLERGIAFPMVKRLLALNAPDDSPVEVILLSRNDPDTGLRVMKSIEAEGLSISRAAFLNGGLPYLYTDAFNVSLFLSGNAEDVNRAARRGVPAGMVMSSTLPERTGESMLRIAFDFDGVLADGSAQAVYDQRDLASFHQHESDRADTPLPAGPLARFFRWIARLQDRERDLVDSIEGHAPRLRTAIATARNAPAHERVVTTLRHWQVEVDEVFFLGGIDKTRVLEVFRPHIFFDDQESHLEAAAKCTPCVHVPILPPGEATKEVIEEARAEDEARHAGMPSYEGDHDGAG